MSISTRAKRSISCAASLSVLILFFITATVKADDGYRLWLRYDKISEPSANAYRSKIKSIIVTGNSETLDAARNELKIGLDGLLDESISQAEKLADGALIVGTPKTSTLIAG